MENNENATMGMLKERMNMGAKAQQSAEVSTTANFAGTESSGGLDETFLSGNISGITDEKKASIRAKVENGDSPSLLKLQRFFRKYSVLGLFIANQDAYINASVSGKIPANMVAITPADQAKVQKYSDLRKLKADGDAQYKDATVKTLQKQAGITAKDIKKNFVVSFKEKKPSSVKRVLVTVPVCEISIDAMYKDTLDDAQVSAVVNTVPVTKQVIMTQEELISHVSIACGGTILDANGNNLEIHQGWTKKELTGGIIQKTPKFDIRRSDKADKLSNDNYFPLNCKKTKAVAALTEEERAILNAAFFNKLVEEISNELGTATYTRMSTLSEADQKIFDFDGETCVSSDFLTGAKRLEAKLWFDANQAAKEEIPLRELKGKNNTASFIAPTVNTPEDYVKYAASNVYPVSVETLAEVIKAASAKEVSAKARMKRETASGSDAAKRFRAMDSGYNTLGSLEMKYNA